MRAWLYNRPLDDSVEAVEEELVEDGEVVLSLYMPKRTSNCVAKEWKTIHDMISQHLSLTFRIVIKKLLVYDF